MRETEVSLSRCSSEVSTTAEIRYRRLFESVSNGIVILDGVTQKITDVNPFMTELSGYTRDEFLGKELWEIGLMKDKEASLYFFGELHKKDRIFFDALPIKTKQGEKQVVEFTTALFSDDLCQVVQCYIHDISKHTRVEAELKKREVFLSAILANLTDTVVACDAAGKLTLFDQTTLESHELLETIPPEEWAERFQLYNPDGKTLMHMKDVPLYRALHEGQVQNAEMKTKYADGTMHTMIINGQALFDENNQKLGAVVVMNDITDYKSAEEILQKAETKYRNLVEFSPGIVYLNEPYPPYSSIYISPNIMNFGYSPEEWYADNKLWSSIIYKDDRERVLREFDRIKNQGMETDLKYRIVARDGTIHWWKNIGRFVVDNQGNRTSWQGVILDITENKALEEQLRQSQKLESVGLLASGIAHDFNNMLTAINGYSDLTLRKLNEDDPLRNYIEEIKKAGQRSAELTHQLLAFSRQQVLQPSVVDLNEIIADVSNLLQRLIGENIQLTNSLNPKLGQVKVDPGQFSQIIMNLVVNARDAILNQGGQITIETANIFLDPTYTRHHVGFLPGAYVMLAVSDTGTGMNDETKQHIFEPFFTTKEVGKGTGLGLATVYGIVKQSGGNILVYSEEGIGTTFKIYLPRVVGKVDEMVIKETTSEILSGPGTILLVEDEEQVRQLSKEVLENSGYTIIAAENGEQALSICEQDCQIELLMTDVVMPKMGGRELAERLVTKYPKLKVLFTSGYTDDAVMRHGIIETNSNFIQKPYSPDGLARKVKEILQSFP